MDRAAPPEASSSAVPGLAAVTVAGVACSIALGAAIFSESKNNIDFRKFKTNSSLRRLTSRFVVADMKEWARLKVAG